MKILENFSLKSYNTFAIDAYAKYFAAFDSKEILESLLDEKKISSERSFILGGGSNILFTKNFEGVVLKNEIKGIGKIKEDEQYVYVKAGAGEGWHSFVLFCIKENLAGVENLSLIPGSVGASPIQNIGAYGVEIKDVFFCLEAYHLKDKKVLNFNADDCGFGYRNSFFKNKYRDEFVILSVTLRLNKKPDYNISYGAIKDELKEMDHKNLNIKAISDAVIKIRSSKLPDPKVLGNAGSFFKNPVIKNEQFKELSTAYPAIPFFKNDEEHVKVPAGWVIEQCGWKGYRNGDAGCYDKQALVLVNYGNASGNNILQLSEEIMTSVLKKFKVMLEREVNII